MACLTSTSTSFPKRYILPLPLPTYPTCPIKDVFSIAKDPDNIDFCEERIIPGQLAFTHAQSPVQKRCSSSSLNSSWASSPRHTAPWLVMSREEFKHGDKRKLCHLASTTARASLPHVLLSLRLTWPRNVSPVPAEPPAECTFCPGTPQGDYPTFLLCLQRIPSFAVPAIDMSH